MPVQIPGMFENYPDMLSNSPNLYNQEIATWMADMNRMQQEALAASIARQQAAVPSSNALLSNPEFLANLEALGRGIPAAPAAQQEAPGFWSQVWNRAIDPVQGSLYGMVGLFGDLIGNDTIRDWGIEGYQRNLQEAEEGNRIAPRQVPTIEDIHSLGDAGTWFMETLADQVPNLAMMAGSAGVGGLLGRGAMNVAGQTFARKFAEKEMKNMAANAMAAGVGKKAAEEAAMKQIPLTLGTRWGANTGLYGSLGSIESGSAYGEDVKKHGVEGTSPWMDLGVGVANAGLERWMGMEGSILRNMVGQPVKESTKKAVGNILARGAKKLFTSATKEGVTEALQETTQMLNEKIQDNELGKFTPEDTSRLLNSFVAGAALGGPMGMLDSGAVRYRGEENPDIEKYREQVFNPLYDEANKIPENLGAVQSSEWGTPDNDFLNSWANQINETPLQSLNEEAQNTQEFFTQAKNDINTKYDNILTPMQRSWDMAQSNIAQLQATPAQELGITEEQKNLRIKEAKKALVQQAAQITNLKEQQRQELEKVNKQEETQKNKLAKNVLNTAEQLKQQPLAQNPYVWSQLMNIRKETENYSSQASANIRGSLDTVRTRLATLQDMLNSVAANRLTPKDVQGIRDEIKSLRAEEVKLTGNLRKISNVSNRILSKTSDPKKMYTNFSDAQADFETLRNAGNIEDVTSVASSVNAPIVDTAAKQQQEQEQQILKQAEQQRKELEKQQREQAKQSKADERKKVIAEKEKKAASRARGKYPDEQTVLNKSNTSTLPTSKTVDPYEIDMDTALSRLIRPNDHPSVTQVKGTRQAQELTGSVDSLVQDSEQSAPQEQTTATSVEEKANAREDLANTPKKSRILPTDNDVVVKRKIVEQLKNAGRGKRAADEAQILMRMLKSLESVTGETPAQIMQRLNFSLNMPVSEQIKKSLEQTAYHGTPFEGKIDKLSTDYLGSGEGAQVHGWGLYVALNEHTAKHYQNLNRQKMLVTKIGGKQYTSTSNLQAVNDIYNAYLNEGLPSSIAEELSNIVAYSYSKKDAKDYIKSRKSFCDEALDELNFIVKHQSVAPSTVIENKFFDLSEDLATLGIRDLEKKLNKILYSDAISIDNLLSLLPEIQDAVNTKTNDFNFIQDFIKDKLEEKSASSGQRMRVEIPEDNVMLREEATISEQSDFVQKVIADKLRLSQSERLRLHITTGKDFYEYLTRINDNDPARASMVLLTWGIRGIRYYGHRDGECAVIFDGDDINIVEHFYDQQGRGRIDFLQDGTANIIFKDSADASTAIHEFEHFFMNEAGRILNDTTIPDSPAKQQLAQDIQKLGEFAGESPETASNPHNWSTEAHEKVSKSFELYFRTGKAPEGAGLDALFKRMKDLLVQLYQKATSILGIRNLPKDIRQVFDKQLTNYKKEAAKAPKEKASKVTEKVTPEVARNEPEMAPTAPKQETTSSTPSGNVMSRSETVRRLLEQRAKPVEAGPVNTNVFSDVTKAKDSFLKSFKALEGKIQTVWAPVQEHKNDLGYIDTNNQIVLVASNIEKYAKQTGKSINDITKQVIKHEGLGHYGLRTVLDSRGLSKFLDDVYDSLSGTQAWELFKENTPGFSELTSRQQAEEFCAALAEQVETSPKASALVKSAWTKLKSLVKPLLDGLGVSSLGKPFALNKKDGKLTQQDIIEILKAGANKLSNTNTQAMSAPEVDMSKRMANPDLDRYELAVEEANRTLLGRGVDALHDSELRQDFVEGFIERFVDALRPIQRMVRQLKEQGGAVNYATNIYKKLQALPNVTAVHLAQHKTEFVDPLIEVISKTGKPGEKAELTFERFSAYAEALAGKERNQWREKQKGWWPGEKPITGKTTKEWQDIIDKYKSPEMDEAISAMQRLNHARIELMRKYNLLPAEVLDNWEAAYKYYMPFKNWENVLQEAAPEWYKGDTRRSISTPNLQRKLGQRAKGKEGMSENPVAHAVMQLYDVVYLADKVQAGRSFLQLVDDNPNATDIFEKVVFREPGKEARKDWPGLKRVINKKTGEISYTKTKSTAEGKMSDTVAILDKDGNVQRVLVKDPKVLKALKGENIIQASPMIRWIGSLTHTLGKYITSRNPLFWLRNPLRDTITAAINMQAVAHELESMGIVNANEVAKAIVTKGLMSSFKKQGVRGALTSYYRTGKTDFKDFDAETQAYMQNFKDFLEYGGQTEYFGTNTYDAIKKDLVDALASTNPQTKMEHGKAIVDKFGKYMDSISDALENQTRYIAFNEIVNGIIGNAEQVGNGVYKRPNGGLITEQEIKERAANIALNLTVNFSRKGSWAPVFNSLFMFASASIGGNVRMLETIFAKDPKTGKASMKNLIRFSAYPLLGYAAQAMIARALMPDDDDGINKYDKIPGYVKESNLIIPSPFFDGSYITLPLPYGFNIFWTMARGIVDSAISAKEGTPGPSFTGAMTSTVSSAFDNFAAIGQTSEGLNMFIPSVFRPLYQLAINKNFAGSPIKPEGNSYARGDVPESQKYWSTTNQTVKDLCKWINEATGGSEVKGGVLDVSPESLEHLANSYLGGLGRMFFGMMGRFDDLVRGKGFDAGKMPGFNIFYRTSQDSDTSALFSKLRTEAMNTINAVDNARKSPTMSSLEKMAIMQENREGYKLKGILSRVQDGLNKLRQQERVVDRSNLSTTEKTKRLEELRKKKTALMMRFNKAAIKAGVNEVE